MKTRAKLLFAFLLLFGSSAARAATPPRVGDLAPNFSLLTLDDKPIELNQLVATGDVVIVVLRGWPGYQCPLCARQVHDFAIKADQFKGAGARLLMVYPGPANHLKAHAREFLENKQWPADFILVLDPEYEFTNAYGLRWEAKNETAYPSTFVIGRDGKLRFAEVSKSHGGRVSAERALTELK